MTRGRPTRGNGKLKSISLKYRPEENLKERIDALYPYSTSRGDRVALLVSEVEHKRGMVVPKTLMEVLDDKHSDICTI
jgi:hypothetical protein